MLLRVLSLMCVLGFVGAFSNGLGAQDGDPFGGADPFGPAVQIQKAPKAKAKSKAVTPATQSKKKFASHGSEANDRIVASLDQEISLALIETPVSEAVATISRDLGIPIVIDRRSLEEIGLTEDAPINIDLKNVSARAYLRLALRDLDMTYVVRDEVLMITTEEAAMLHSKLLMYPLPQEMNVHAEDIMRAIQTTVSPELWTPGQASISSIGDILVISAPQIIHDQVEDFLKKLSDAMNPQ